MISANPIRAVLFDFGGVMTTSPFDAFTRYEAEAGVPDGLIRTINSTNPDENAWAKFERSEVASEGFVELFEAEAAALGYAVDGNRVLGCLSGDIRPEMVEALRRIKAAGYITACLTNNMRDNSSPSPKPGSVMGLFDHVVESSKLGIRKPEPGFYHQALELAGVDATEAVFLDDLGINLKPARAMGMTTIKVVSGQQTLTDLEAVMGMELATSPQ